MKKLISLLTALIVCISALCIGAYATDESCGFAVANDIHYVHPLSNADDYVDAKNFVTNEKGAYFQHESGFIIDEFLSQCAENDDCDFILIPGDLATYGREYVEDHYALAQKFRDFEKNTGKQVYVINGNHDNGIGEKTDSAKFREIYYEFGYDKAFSVDESCCSYAVNLNDKYGLIALDSCDENYRLANGVDYKRIDWVRKQAKAITDSGRYPIMIMHHNLLEHMPLELIIQDKYILSLPRTYASMFADWGIKLVFTGHTHLSDAVSYTSPTGNVIYDFCTSALSAYPMQYRHFSLTDETISYDMKTVKKIDTDALSAVVSGYSEEVLHAMATDFPAFAGEREKDRNLSSIKEIISAAGLGISEDSPVYGFVDTACNSINEIFEMPLYGENSVRELANKYGIDIPDSKHRTIWDMVGDVSLDYIAGNKSYGNDSVEVKILLGGATTAIREITRGKSDSFISSVAETITDNGSDYAVNANKIVFTTPAEKLASAIVSVAVEAFCNDNDGVDNISGTVPGYGVQTNGFSNVCNVIISAYSKFIMYINIIIGKLCK